MPARAKTAARSRAPGKANGKQGTQPKPTAPRQRKRAQGRGALFIGAGTPVYEGMVIGESPKSEDINVNVCKTKHLTNTRSSASDEALRLITPKKMSLEECLEFIADDELLEITPKNIRIRKRILDSELRAKARAKEKKQA